MSHQHDNARAHDDAQQHSGSASAQLRRAVFLDRDGTLNEEVGHLLRMGQFEMYPFSSRAVRRINEAGLLAIVITNQSGVARGFFPEEQVHTANAQLIQHIEAEGGRIDRVYYCPHHPEGPLERYKQVCLCRKPAPGMLEQAAAEFGIQLRESFVVGDRWVDIEVAHRVGASSVLVLTGAGREELDAHRAAAGQPHHVAINVEEAVRWILNRL